MYLIDVTRWIIEIECYAELQVEITLGILVSKVLDLSQLILSRMIDQLTYAPINGRTNIYKFKYVESSYVVGSILKTASIRSKWIPTLFQNYLGVPSCPVHL